MPWQRHIHEFNTKTAVVASWSLDMEPLLALLAAILYIILCMMACTMLGTKVGGGFLS